MTTTMCLSGAVLLKAGADVNSTLSSTGGDDIDSFINEAENEINVIGRYDFITNWASLTANTKLMLQKLCAGKAAIEAVRYDLDSYPNRVIAEDIINTLLIQNDEIITLLKDPNNVTFMGGTSG